MPFHRAALLGGGPSSTGSAIASLRPESTAPDAVRKARRSPDLRSAEDAAGPPDGVDIGQRVGDHAAVRGWLAIVLAGAGAVPCFAVWLSGDSPPEWAVLPWLYVACGLFALYRQPQNLTGRLLLATGVTFFIDVLQFNPEPGLWTLGLALGFAYIPMFGHLVLAFPTGRLATIGNRLFVAGAWLYLVAVGIGDVLSYNPSVHGCAGCSRDLNLLFVQEPTGFLAELKRVSKRLHEFPAPLIAVGVLLALIVFRWSSASPPARRLLTPVFAPAAVFMPAFVVLDLGRTGFALHDLLLRNPSLDSLVRTIALLGGIAVPVGFLLGLARMQGRTARVGELVVELGELPSLDRLQASLARVLGDPSVRVGRWEPAQRRYITAAGTPLDMPRTSADSLTFLERDGTPLAVIVHDSALMDAPELLQAVNAATRLAVDNERLQAELRAQLDETRASRVRIVAAADDARRRLERDLHDGVQQRLVTLAMEVRLVEAGLADASTREAVAAIGDEMASALHELRDFARGVHPAVLTEEGLAPALKSLAERSPTPVRLLELPTVKLDAAQEAAIYFVVSEALANVSKHAHATSVTIAARCVQNTLEVEIADDGVGGAAVGKGSGLRGLTDRVAAVDGALTLTSKPGAGTTVRATIPLGVGAQDSAF